MKEVIEKHHKTLKKSENIDSQITNFLQLFRKGFADFGFGAKEIKSPSNNRFKNVFLFIWLLFKESKQSHCIEENRNRWKNSLRNHLSSF